MPRLLFTCVFINLLTGLIQVLNKFIAYELEEFAAFFVIYAVAWILSAAALLRGALFRPPRPPAASDGRAPKPACGTSGHPVFSRPEAWFLIAGVIALGQVLSPLLYFQALNRTSVFTQSFIYLLYPASMVLTGLLRFKEKKNRLFNLGLGLMAAGYAIFLYHIFWGHRENIQGIYYLLGSVACLCLHKILHKILLQKHPGAIDDVWLSFLGLGAGSVVALALVVRAKQYYFTHLFTSLTVWPEKSFFYMFFCALGGSVFFIHHFYRNRLLRHVGLSTIFPYSPLSTVFVAALTSVVYWAYPDRFPFQPVSGFAVTSMIFILWGSVVIFYSDLPPGGAEAPGRRRATARTLGFTGLNLGILLTGLFLINHADAINHALMKSGNYREITALARDKAYGAVHQVSLIECEEQNSDHWQYGLYVSASEKDFIVECTDPGEAENGEFFAEPAPKPGHIFNFVDRAGRPRPARLLGPMGARPYLFKGLDTQTGGLLVIQKLYPDEIENYREVLRRVDAQAERWTKLPSRERAQFGDLYFIPAEDPGQAYRVVPFLYGKSFYNYFGFDRISRAEDYPYSARGRAAHLIDKIIETGRLARLFYQIGLYSRALTRENAFIKSGNLNVHLLYSSLSDIAKPELVDNLYEMNLTNLFGFFYPLSVDVHTSVLRDLPYLTFRPGRDDINRKANLWLTRMRDKITDGSYSWGKPLDPGDREGLRRSLTAMMDEFLGDLEKLKEIIAGKGPDVPLLTEDRGILPDAGIEALLRAFESAVSLPAARFVELGKLYGRKNPLPLLACVKVPSLVNPREDIIILGKELTARNINEFDNLEELDDFLLDKKPGLVVVSRVEPTEELRRAVLEFLRENIPSATTVRFRTLPGPGSLSFFNTLF
jgi:drug/metabolite transporter (DMT)-like permease